MFDEVKNNQAAAPVSARSFSASAALAPAGPIRAEDIFAEVDKTAKPEVFRSNPDNIPPARGTVIPPETGWKKNKMAVLGLLFGGLIVIVAGGYFGLKLATSKPAVNNAVVEESLDDNQAETPAPAAEIDNTAAPLTQPVVTAPVDSDLDGLLDTEEITLSTDINNPDTDRDGLTDREEAKVYLTDPLNSDTDNDSFKDGAEIANGYNPKGSGKLLEIK